MKKLGIVLGIALAIIFSVCSFTKTANDIKDQKRQEVYETAYQVEKTVKETLDSINDEDPYDDIPIVIPVNY